MALFTFLWSAPAWTQTLHWYRGNTHTHTVNSDGNSTADVVATWYREHGYQFLFITDHEYLTDPRPLNAIFGADEQFLLLPGQEVTQWTNDPKRAAARVTPEIGAPAHLNALFASRVVIPVGERPCFSGGCGANAPGDMPVSQALAQDFAAIRAEGAIPQINHPNLLWSLKPEDLAETPDGALIEVWNGAGSIVNNLGGDDGVGDVRPSPEGFWDWLLSHGKIVWAVGSDDAHDFKTPDATNDQRAQAWIVVRAPALTSGCLRAAIAGGDFYASTGVALSDIQTDGSQLTITIKPEQTPISGYAPRYITRFVGKGGKVLATVAGLKPHYQFNGAEDYVRASVIDSNDKRAWIQPVFLDRRRAAVPQPSCELAK